MGALRNIPDFLRGFVSRRPQDGWVREAMSAADDNWHKVVAPPGGYHVVVTDLFLSNYSAQGSKICVAWVHRLSGVTVQLFPMAVSYEGAHFQLGAHWTLPVNAWLCCRRHIGTDMYCVSAMGYFARGGGVTATTVINTPVGGGW